MPELPEVEAARRNLARWLRGATLEGVVVRDARILEGVGARSFVHALDGARVQGVNRRGKWLRIRLRDGAHPLLFSHLGMTGKWVRRRPGEPAGTWDRVVLTVRFASRATWEVRYVDPRLFGGLRLCDEDPPAWNALGPDPLNDGIDRRTLAGALARRKAPIKVVLLDQTVLAGIGNIQAAESLFLAHIDPRRSAASLSATEVSALIRGIHKSIQDTLAQQAPHAKEIVYVEEPKAHNPFRVYGKAGQKCPRCRTPIERIVQAARSTFFCPRCQTP